MLSSVAEQTMQWAKGKAQGAGDAGWHQGRSTWLQAQQMLHNPPPQQLLRILLPKSGPYFTVVVGNLKAECCQ